MVKHKACLFSSRDPPTRLVEALSLVQFITVVCSGSVALFGLVPLCIQYSRLQ
jgi:hypothetical protein